jgi:hypothetical protein
MPGQLLNTNFQEPERERKGNKICDTEEKTIPLTETRVMMGWWNGSGDKAPV